MTTAKFLLAALVASASAGGILTTVSCTATTANEVRLESKTVGEKVMFTVTPKGLADGRLLFDMRVNTHEGELADLDLRGAVRLHFGERVLAPVEVPNLRGHHAGGVLAFAHDSLPKRFSLTIRNVPGEPTLRASWP